MVRGTAIRCCLLVALGAPAALTAPAGAAPLGLSACRDAHGVHQCSGFARTWDGVPLDVTLVLPRAGAARLPLVVEMHGFGNSKHEYLDPASRAYTDNAYGWARAGYAVLTYTARGQWESCGTPESRIAHGPACARGYLHLADTRFEVRDAQELIGRLVDDGIAHPARIGVTGDSYAGGQIMQLAALRDRVMLPDGSLVAWRSPGGRRLRLAAAAPVIPWTDLVYTIAPNGQTFTHTVMPPDASSQPPGVFKASYANAILAASQFAVGPGQPAGEAFVPGRPIGFVAPPGADPEIDLVTWMGRANAGEPYDDEGIRNVIRHLRRFHSAYHVPPDSPPPPLFVASGFTDDLFPPIEALRFANRTRRLHPRVPLSLLFGDFGHMRGANKAADRERVIAAIHRWFDHYVRDRGARPPAGVTVLTQTCPSERPSGGPFTAPTFEALARGEVRHVEDAPRRISSGGDDSTARSIDPVFAGNTPCGRFDAADVEGTAVYRLPAAPAGGYTLLGAPTIDARLAVLGARAADTQIAGRLWDVAPDGQQTLVARGLMRPSGGDRDLWQLYPNGWRFEAGHVPRLELLTSDAPFGRPSNAAFSVDVERLELRLPVREPPDCGIVLARAALLRPPGQELAPGVPAGASDACDPRRPRLRLTAACRPGGLRARAVTTGARARRVDFYVGRRHASRDTRAPFVRMVTRRARRPGRVRLTARAALVDGRRLTARRTVRACLRR